MHSDTCTTCVHTPRKRGRPRGPVPSPGGLLWRTENQVTYEATIGATTLRIQRSTRRGTYTLIAPDGSQTVHRSMGEAKLEAAKAAGLTQ